MTEGSEHAALSDSALLARHAAGDTEAFGEVFRRHRDRLWAVALRTTGNREDAADAVQDAFISAMRASVATGAASAAFRGDSAVTTWLHRIVVNACLDRLRRRAVRPTVPLPMHPLPAAEQRGSTPAAYPDVYSELETSLDVTRALAELPVAQRTALVLVDMYGWSVEETARVLDCAPGTVKSRCARGRARLLPLLRDSGGGGEPPGAGNRASSSHVPPRSAQQPAAGPATLPATGPADARGEVT